MRAKCRAACVACVLLIVSLQAQSPLPKNTWRLADAPPEYTASISRANLVMLTMQSALLRELTSALEQGGPERAVNSCHIDLVRVIQRANLEPGVEAGRTSHRLRNPLNAPRPWAAPLVEANVGRLAKDVEGFVVDLGEKAGVLRSIALQPTCAACHGSETDISPGVRAALDLRYPSDRAVGFKVGEIRGWFWVELPKSAH